MRGMQTLNKPLMIFGSNTVRPANGQTRNLKTLMRTQANGSHLSTSPPPGLRQKVFEPPMQALRQVLLNLDQGALDGALQALDAG